MVQNSEVEVLNILKLPQHAQGNGHFGTVSQGNIPTLDRTGHNILRLPVFFSTSIIYTFSLLLCKKTSQAFKKFLLWHILKSLLYKIYVRTRAISE